MTEKLNILALIPARSGSKSIPDKNIKLFRGKPLISYSIEQAFKSLLINRVIVSTDSEQYAIIAKHYGAEVPFLRPPEISADTSTDLDFFLHALEWLFNNERYIPDICVQLRPTHPIRNTGDIDNMISMLIDDPEADSVRSVVENANIIPFKMWFMTDGLCLKPVTEIKGIDEAYNMPRQMLPKTYFQNASVDVIRASCILNKRSLSGSKILGYVMKEQFDIDYEEDFIRAEKHFIRSEILNCTNKKICFDIDGVIATLTQDNDYSMARPVDKVILIINELYNKGNTILLFTARGSETGIDWRAITEKQMKDWGVKYHQLIFGKPGADVFIDDRAVNISDLII